MQVSLLQLTLMATITKETWIISTMREPTSMTKQNLNDLVSGTYIGNGTVHFREIKITVFPNSQTGVHFIFTILDWENETHPWPKQPISFSICISQLYLYKSSYCRLEPWHPASKTLGETDVEQAGIQKHTLSFGESRGKNRSIYRRWWRVRLESI